MKLGLSLALNRICGYVGGTVQVPPSFTSVPGPFAFTENDNPGWLEGIVVSAGTATDLEIRMEMDSNCEIIFDDTGLVDVILTEGTAGSATSLLEFHGPSDQVIERVADYLSFLLAVNTAGDMPFTIKIREFGQVTWAAEEVIIVVVLPQIPEGSVSPYTSGDPTTELEYTWTTVSGTEPTIRIQYSLVESENDEDFNDVETSTTVDGSGVLSGLEPNTTYYFRFRNEKNGQVSGWYYNSGNTDPATVTPVLTISEGEFEYLNFAPDESENRVIDPALDAVDFGDVRSVVVTITNGYVTNDTLDHPETAWGVNGGTVTTDGSSITIETGGAESDTDWRDILRLCKFFTDGALLYSLELDTSVRTATFTMYDEADTVIETATRDITVQLQTAYIDESALVPGQLNNPALPFPTIATAAAELAAINAAISGRFHFQNHYTGFDTGIYTVDTGSPFYNLNYYGVLLTGDEVNLSYWPLRPAVFGPGENLIVIGSGISTISEINNDAYDELLEATPQDLGQIVARDSVAISLLGVPGNDGEDSTDTAPVGADATGNTGTPDDAVGESGGRGDNASSTGDTGATGQGGHSAYNFIVDGPATVTYFSAKGGDGGKGGTGGDGGTVVGGVGGKGGDGFDDGESTPADGFNGGDGGDAYSYGGPGGTGGGGGYGGTLTLRNGATCTAYDVGAGAGGFGGDGGGSGSATGGDGGLPGLGVNGGSDGSAGTAGNSYEEGGIAGNDGTSGSIGGIITE